MVDHNGDQNEKQDELSSLRLVEDDIEHEYGTFVRT